MIAWLTAETAVRNYEWLAILVGPVVLFIASNMMLSAANERLRKSTQRWREIQEMLEDNDE